MTEEKKQRRKLTFADKLAALDERIQRAADKLSELTDERARIVEERRQMIDRMSAEVKSA